MQKDREDFVSDDYVQGELGLAPNALGYYVNTSTLTKLIKEITQQRFFDALPINFLPVKVGKGAWSSEPISFGGAGEAQPESAEPADPVQP